MIEFTYFNSYFPNCNMNTYNNVKIILQQLEILSKNSSFRSKSSSVFFLIFFRKLFSGLDISGSKYFSGLKKTWVFFASSPPQYILILFPFHLQASIEDVQTQMLGFFYHPNNFGILCFFFFFVLLNIPMSKLCRHPFNLQNDIYIQYLFKVV